MSTRDKDGADKGDSRQWPALLDARDPFAERLPAGQQRAFLEAWREVDTTGTGFEALERQARALGLTAPLLPETAPMPVLQQLPPLEALVRIATDHDPAIGAVAPDLVLGPWADWADLPCLAVAVAWGAMHALDEAQPSPVERWLKGPLGPQAVHAHQGAARLALAALLKAPPAPYRVLSYEGDRVELRPLVELGRRAPQGWVRLHSLAAPASPLKAGGGLVARVVTDSQGQLVALMGFALPEPELPPSWLAMATWRARASGDGVRTISDVLRARAPHLVRRMLEREWLREWR